MDLLKTNKGDSHIPELESIIKEKHIIPSIYKDYFEHANQEGLVEGDEEGQDGEGDEGGQDEEVQDGQQEMASNNTLVQEIPEELRNALPAGFVLPQLAGWVNQNRTHLPVELQDNQEGLVEGDEEGQDGEGQDAEGQDEEDQDGQHDQNVFKEGNEFYCNCICGFRSKKCQTVISHLKDTHHLKPSMPTELCSKCNEQNTRVFQNRHKCKPKTRTRKGKKAHNFQCTICLALFGNHLSLQKHQIKDHRLSVHEAKPVATCIRCGETNKSVFQNRHICS